jgi:hypothetical protein
MFIAQVLIPFQSVAIQMQKPLASLNVNKEKFWWRRMSSETPQTTSVWVDSPPSVVKPLFRPQQIVSTLVSFLNCTTHHPELTVVKIAVTPRIPAARPTSPISKPPCPALAVCAQMANTLVSAARTLFHMRTVNGKVYLQRVQMASKQLFVTLVRSRSVSSR